MTSVWKMYGDDGGNRFDLIVGEDGTGELSARIDARTDAESFMTCIGILMMEMECELYAPELDQVVPATIPSLKAALQLSEAWTYAVARG